MTRDETLRELFAELALGLSGHRVNNGGDYYLCSCCLEETPIMGYCDARAHITEGQHKSGCKLLALYHELEAGRT
jgi:hypothetical protein